ncbi:MAG: PEP-CTERM sorting domain-containing protein [Alphaproteobacteria bacterium]|nr:PEP-CTERM sorting domain-containing protein [Alphaproteobacteria bacterium]MBU1513852.1 PEP-CTERM sorting domain-containing protein [Alphaproteobacteria bacterium]MBU2094503.1 PEP-CTERM sorting domain-containing protein [Alphaproteobacteria bacterium]MBU2151236.1 PEP-CTERM sorting domain-containing protein [Alphaproteobacteria bacterium]MBU2305894.1 PEP-CTERM sorting domain-containing protein [Alphaproteobacteria bacterium]
MSVKFLAALAATAALVPAAPALAANLLVNGGFEATPTLPLQYDQYAPAGHIQHYPAPAETAQYVPGWTLGDPSVSDLYRAPVVYGLVPAAAAEGQQFLSLNWSPLGSVILHNSVSQAFVLGAGASGFDFAVFMAVESGYAGSTLQAQILDASLNVVAQSAVFTHLGGNGTWSEKTWTADLAPGTYTLKLNGTGNDNAWDVLIDDVRLTQIDGGASPAPEPATWALMLMGFLGTGAMIRRRSVAKLA